MIPSKRITTPGGSKSPPKQNPVMAAFNRSWFIKPPENNTTMNFITYIFADYARATAFLLLVSLLCATILRMWKLWLTSQIIKKNGYPPSHCDAWGDPYDEDIDIKVTAKTTIQEEQD